MGAKKQPEAKPATVTLKSEKTMYTVHLDDGIVSVEATSAEEAIKKAEAKEDTE
jgi:hypothetical protein